MNINQLKQNRAAFIFLTENIHSLTKTEADDALFWAYWDLNYHRFPGTVADDVLFTTQQILAMCFDS